MHWEQLPKNLCGGNKTTKEQANVYEGDIQGDTVTFGFYSQRSGYYGYYAVVTANGYNIISGAYEEPKLTDYRFAGWADTNDATVPSYNNAGGEIAGIIPNGKVYAVYGYNIEYDLNGGQVGSGYYAAKNISSQIKLKNVDLALTSITLYKTGFTFAGWDEDPNKSYDSVTYSTSSLTYSKNSSAKLYAIWKPIEYTVRYEKNASGQTVTNMPANQIKYGGVDLTLASEVPVREGFEFLGWMTTWYGTVPNYMPGGTYNTNSSVVLYALWGHKVIYDANGGEGAPAMQYKLQDTKLSISNIEPTKEGWMFAGWATSSTSNNVLYHPNDIYEEEENLNLYAVYGRTITLDPNGGSIRNVPTAVAKVNGVDLLLPYEVPVKADKVFAGWGLSASGSALYHPGDAYTQDGDNTLYAIWEDECVVTFDANGLTFANGLTSNSITYRAVPENTSSTTTYTLYSHTPNIDDNGVSQEEYGCNFETNEVITIPGASSLHVKLYYSTYTYGRDWVCVWPGAHPEYTTLDDGEYSSIGDRTGWLYGGDSYTMEDASIIEGDIEGNSVTFGFRADDDIYNYYGYYAIITGEGYNIDELRTSGTYMEPELPSDYRFLGWSLDPNAETGIYMNEKELIAKAGANMKLYAIAKRFVSQYLPGSEFNSKLSRYWYHGIRFSETKPSEYDISRSINVGVEGDDFKPIYAWVYDDDNIINLWSEADSILLNNDASGMFSNIDEMYSLNVTQDLGLTSPTTNVTNMSSMFENNYNLGSLELGDMFDTRNVTDMSRMFYDLGTSSLDLGNHFDTSNVTDMSYMFSELSCNSLDLGDHFDTSSVTNMSYMFNYMNIDSVDLGPLFNTRNVTDMSYMFANSEQLKKIYVPSSFDKTSLQNSDGMFESCFAIEGGNGTPYDNTWTYIDAEYARIDGENGLEGYFTARP